MKREVGLNIRMLNRNRQISRSAQIVVNVRLPRLCRKATSYHRGEGGFAVAYFSDGATHETEAPNDRLKDGQIMPAVVPRQQHRLGRRLIVKKEKTKALIQLRLAGKESA